MEETAQFDINFKNLDGRLITALEKIGEIFRVMLWDVAKETGLSPIQIQILIFLRNHHEPLRRVAHLAREFNLTKATISDAVRVLEEKHLIIKLPDPNDARSQILKLTITGVNISKELNHFSDPLQSVLGKMEESTKADLYSTTIKLLNQLAQDKVINSQRMCFTCTFFDNHGVGGYCNYLNKDLTHGEVKVDCPVYTPAA
ncbi:hypothetical protein BH11BAC2_BH11BAC2_05610 [soil metagenome]